MHDRELQPTWQRLVSTDSDEVSEKMESSMRDVFTPQAIGLDFTYDRSFLAMGPVTFMASPGTSHSAMFSPADPSMICAGLVTAGVVEAEGAAGRRRIGPSESVVLPMTTSLTTYNYDSEVDVVNLDTEGVVRAAAEFLGRDVAHVRFADAAPRSRDQAAFWWRTAQYVSKVVAQTQAATSPMIRSESFRLLSAALLETFPHEIVEPGGRHLDRVEPAVIRRAVAYIEAHAHEPDLDTVAVAAASGLGVRALQLGFRRHRGTTPMAYVRRVRLARAHEELVAADPCSGTTVAEVAARWGYASASHFSTHYRTAYGVRPSETLRR